MDYRDIIVDIRKIVRSINLESKRTQKDFGISIPQLLCLAFLKKQPDFQSTHKQLNAYLNLNSSTVTGILNRLEKKGFIARLPKRGDKRVTNVALTSSGFEVLERAPDLLHETLSRNLSDLSDAKIGEIKAALQLLVRALGIQDVDASPLLVVEDPIAPED